MRNALPLIAFGLLLVGCGPKPSVVGSWTVTGGELPKTAKTTFTFAQDDKLTVRITGKVYEIAGTEPDPNDPNMTVTITGTYSVSGDVLTAKLDDAKVVLEGIDQKIVDEAMAAQKEKFLEQMGQAEKSKLQWVSDGEFKTLESSTYRFVRQKP